MEHQLVVTHGNGPQVGWLALQQLERSGEEGGVPLDVLGAQTEGMIGYLIEQELGNLLPFYRPLATLLTMVEVDPFDPAFTNPTKFIGPVYSEQEAQHLERLRGWKFRRDGDKWRRVVASPEPKRIFEIRPIRWLLRHGTVVITAGGGGIPTMYRPDRERELVGIECVVDKDLAAELLARELQADCLLLLTATDFVYRNWGCPKPEAIVRASPDRLREHSFPAGSMGPKVEAACRFVERTGKRAAIGALSEAQAVFAGKRGTQVVTGEGVLELGTLPS
jgi:carbamate kinase